MPSRGFVFTVIFILLAWFLLPRIMAEMTVAQIDRELGHYELEQKHNELKQMQQQALSESEQAQRLAAQRAALSKLRLQDANLEKCIWETLTAPGAAAKNLTLSELTSLDCDSYPRQGRIARLDGIGSLPQLQRLDLRDNDIKDLAPLTRLRGLRELDLSNNPIDDVGVLGQMSALETLRLTNVPVSRGLFGLGQLSRLQHLALPNFRKIPCTVEDSFMRQPNIQKLKSLDTSSYSDCLEL